MNTTQRRSDPWFLIGMAAAIFAVMVGGGIGIYLHFRWHLPDNIDRPVTTCSTKER